ncbi:MAG: hypothetical protein WCT53_05510 [Candidatus Gracilibacteria bacterium]|jgi:hypothetical protein
MAIEYDTESTRLTPAFASEDPSGYKASLLNKHGAIDGGRLGMVYEKVLASGMLKVENIVIDPSTPRCKIVDGAGGFQLTLGVLDIEEQERQTMIFEHERFTGEDGIVYKFNHELSHFIIGFLSEISDDFNSLYRLTFDSRSKGRGGFHMKGNQPKYKNQNKPFVYESREDIVELVNMYLLEPDYLKRFLDFLVDPASAQVRASGHLATLSRRQADHFFNTIDTAVKEWLRS